MSFIYFYGPKDFEIYPDKNMSKPREPTVSTVGAQVTKADESRKQSLTSDGSLFSTATLESLASIDSLSSRSKFSVKDKMKKMLVRKQSNNSLY